MASRNASRTVMVTVSRPWGRSGSAAWGVAAAGGDGAGAAGARAVCGSAFGFACAGGADSAALWAAAGAPPSLSAEASSPSAKIIAHGVLTATSAVPSGTRILPSVPSSTASTSMVALSVSISAITSPALTLSPSFLTHLARLPFSMVGESAGISTWIGMESPGPDYLGVNRNCAAWSPRHVGPQFRRIGFGIVGGELGSLVDGVAHARVDLLQLVLARALALEQARSHLLDRIALGANALDLLAAAVLRRIRHGVAAIAIGRHFENDRTVAGAAPRDRLFARGLDRAHVHAVDLLARNVE